MPRYATEICNKKAVLGQCAGFVSELVNREKSMTRSNNNQD